MDNQIWGPDWPEVRALWSLDPSKAHLNYGSFGAVPIPVQRVQEDLRRRVEANPMKSLSRSLYGELQEARAKAASFLSADLEGFVFVPNATTGANTVLASVPLGPRDEVLITDQSYGAVKFAAERVCNGKRARLAVSQISLPKRGSDELVEAVLSKVTPRTRLAIVDHIASPTGIVFPIAKIIRELHSRDVPVLVDAAHAPGMVDVRLNSLDPDYWTGNFHKWCCAPRGSAGLWVKEDHRKTVAPIVTSWYVNEGYPSSFRWLGTDDYTPYLATPAAIDFMASLGWERVRNHNRALARYGRDVVTAGLRTQPPVNPELDDVFEAMTLIQLPENTAETEEEARSLQVLIADATECGNSSRRLEWSWVFATLSSSLQCALRISALGQRAPKAAQFQNQSEIELTPHQASENHEDCTISRSSFFESSLPRCFLSASPSSSKEDGRADA